MTGLITEKLLTGIFLLSLTLAVALFDLDDLTVSAQEQSQILGASTISTPVVQESDTPQPLKTESSFISKIKSEVTTLEFETVVKDDPEREYGEETTLQEGANGKNTKLFKITYTKSINDPEKPGEEFERELISNETIEPKDKIVSRGIKIIWRTLDTPEGQISYWRKMRVYATHYDQFCRGCDQWTAIGMRAGKGVIAVDPKVIKLRSQVYIPGYGKAVAGDTGGAIKGNIIDLGFEDARTAGWSARYVDIYLLDRAPN